MSKYLHQFRHLIVLGITAVRFVSTCPADEGTKQRFLKEYPREAKILKDRWDRYSGSYRVVMPDGKPLANGFSANFFRSHGFEKVEIKVVMPSGTSPLESTFVYCVGDNDSYFTVNKGSDSQYYQAHAVTADERSINAFEQKMGRYIRAFLGGVRKPLITMIEENTATLVDANPVPENGNLIEATFHVSIGSRVSQLVVHVDTRNHWAVVQQEMFINSPPKKTTTYFVEYGDEKDGIAMPVKILVSENNHPYVFDSWKFDETSREAFSITHYGLADLVEAQQVQNTRVQEKRGMGRLVIYLIVGVVVTILAGFGFLVFSKRAGRPHSESAA